MNWFKVTIFTSSSGIDPVSNLLASIGINGITIKDASDFNDFVENNTKYWDYIDDSLMELSNCETTVTAYLPQNSQGNDMLKQLKEDLNCLKSNDLQMQFGRLDIVCNIVNEEDWANNWKQYFKPIKIGSKFIIKPSWEDCSNDDNRIILEIDPGSSFGTGQHSTTSLCIELMENAVSSNSDVLDLGCGSGILSIAALLLGARHVTCVDIDENSLRVAEENLSKNHLPPDAFALYHGDISKNPSLFSQLSAHKYNLITANIVADVLISMSSLFPKLIRQDGILIISGIISERKDGVINSIVQNGFSIINIKEKDGWVAAKLIKDASSKSLNP